MMELLGRMPRDFALSGQRSRRYFTRAGCLRKIQGLNYWPLKNVLSEKYKFNEKESLAFAEFLQPMLNWDPNKRASAQQMLKSKWFEMESNYKTKIDSEEAKVENQEKDQDDYYYKQEMAKLTDGSENEVADGELSRRDPFSDEDFLSEDDFVIKGKKLKRDLANGCNLNNSFGQYDAEDWDSADRDRGANPQFLTKQGR